MKILLNCLPPADINTPSISLSILKTFMQDNGVETEVKYWNFLLSVMAEYIDTEDTEVLTLPFLSILNDKDNNAKGNKRIMSLLQKIDPSHKATDPAYYADFLQDKKDEIYEVIHQEIESIDFSEIHLFGISAKYNQWIPGMILAEEIKKIAPQVKIIVGGFGDKNVANEAMQLCPHFDFGTWGEGEYPLLELSNQLATENPDFEKVPRLMFRQDNALKQSVTSTSQYLDFDNYIYPDYSDYVDNYPEPDDTEQISVPINTIRSCNWLKCKFCDFNQGYKLRARTAECVVNEIEHITNEYGLSTFSFVDSDTFGNLEHFEKLLDLIIALKYKTEEDYVFWAEIIPNAQFTAKLMEKMAIAGFKNIFIGYDGLTDSLLQKMNKRNSFSDNIFFAKHSIKNGISPLVNVIKHVPAETEDDVLESMNNLHFLRFFYNNTTVSFFHTYVELVLSSMSKYYKLMSTEEKATYTDDDFTYLMPDHYSNREARFHLFRYKKNIPSNLKEWNKLIETEEYYKTNAFSYKIQENKGVYYYTEYCNDTEIENIVFGEPEYGLILKTLQEKVFTFTELHTVMQATFKGIPEDRTKELLFNLKSSYLIYCNDEYSNIVSIIELN